MPYNCDMVPMESVGPPRGKRARAGVRMLVLVVAVLVACGTPFARAQLVGDEAPYFLWADAWQGTLDGTDQTERSINQQGVSLKMASTVTAHAVVAYDQSSGIGFTTSWSGLDNRADVTYRAGTFMTADGQARTVDNRSGEGTVALDGAFVFNGLSVDVLARTYTLAFNTCSPALCDPLTVTRSGSITAPGISVPLGDSGPDEQGVGITVQDDLPDPGQGLRENAAPTPVSVAGTTVTKRLDIDLQPRFDVDAWAAAYRQAFLAAAEGSGARAAAEGDVEETCAGPDAVACRDARAWSMSADKIRADFARVANALIDVDCPGFTRALNLFLSRNQDVVVDGPAATYDAVREVLQLSITEDLRVSYQRLPDFMKCLYPFDTYEDMVTVDLPGTTPY